MTARQPKPLPPQDLLSTEAAQHRLGGISRSGLRNLLIAGELRKVNVGARVFIVSDSITEYIERRQQAELASSSN